MKFAIGVLLSAVAVALAQTMTVNTPSGALSCLNQLITWSGGTGPYTIQIQPGGDPSAAALQTFVNIQGTSYSWFVIEPANTQVFIRLHDSTGLTAESGTFTIAVGTTCTGAPTGVTSTATGAAPTTSAAGAPTTTTAAAPPPTTTTAAAGGGGTTPAAGGSTSTPGSGSGSSTTTTHSGAGKMGVAGGALGVLAGVLAIVA